MQLAEQPSKLRELYTSGQYLQKHPQWHVQESEWKAEQILRMFERQGLHPQRICEVGCGAGEVLRQLQLKMGPQSSFWGYDISPQAMEMAKSRENERLHFKLADIHDEKENFDLIMMLDVLEHIEDRYSFLRGLKNRAEYKMFHCSLTISVQTVLRPQGLLHVRDLYGMCNYFTKETLLQTLADAGYKIVDCFYTTACLDAPTHVLGRKLMKIPRRVAFAINQDLAARVLGGFRLLVLAK
jgi:2-polyprenyl-3-methyl-5-hydroxy-6-metoxy-1,4-benzoquinol methylase